jgi:hypothetical protein
LHDNVQIQLLFEPCQPPFQLSDFLFAPYAPQCFSDALPLLLSIHLDSIQRCQQVVCSCLARARETLKRSIANNESIVFKLFN